MDRRVGALMWVALVVVVVCWIVGTPRSAGPDEPSHLVAATGFMSGDLSGDPVPGSGRVRAFDVPAMVGAPDPVCWAFEPNQPVSCAGAPTSDERVRRVTSAHTYAPWAYVLPGLTASVSSPSSHAYLARLADAIVPILLVGFALRFVRSDRVAGAALLFGLTPIVWFMFGTVNPSGMAIAGGVALWAALVGRRERVDRWLAVAGWSCLVLARRDGPLFATLVVLTASMLRSCPPSFWWGVLTRQMRAVVVLAAVAGCGASVLRGDRPAEVVLALAPIGLLVADRVWAVWGVSSPGRRRALAGAGVVVVAAGLSFVATMRPGGWDPNAAELIIGATDDHLESMVGVLGWLDTPSPQITVLLYWAVMGGLLALAIADAPRVALVSAGALVTIVVAAWVLEFGQGDPTGTYWQARYSMPFVVGLPLIAVWRWRDRIVVPRVGVALVVAFVVIANGSFLAAQHRWAVGIYGTWAPWSWDTWGAPAPPWLLIVVHLVATVTLGVLLVRDEPQPSVLGISVAGGDGR